MTALDAYLTARAERAGAGERRHLSGPLLVTVSGGRLRGFPEARARRSDQVLHAHRSG